METDLFKSVRCAIYTRKSGDIGPDEKVSSLDAQREMCSAYIKCNAHRGWREVPRRYDDGGYSGGSLDRPGLKRLLADVEARKVDVVVVYKIDRLTRSLNDFVRVMSKLPASFVSVTQSFDTSDTMGRLILNILLTFAQFEREMVTDRIRDKLRSMKHLGLYAASIPPLGYDKVAGRLVINNAEAELVGEIFRRFETATNAYQLLLELQSEDVRTKEVVVKGRVRGGVLFNRGMFYKMLRNPLYVGLVWDGAELVMAGNEPIIDRETWDRVQDRQRSLTAGRRKVESSRYLLRGLLLDENGRRLIADTNNDGRFPKRYYQTEGRELRRGKLLNKIRVPAPQLEELVKASILSFLSDPVRVRVSLGDGIGEDVELDAIEARSAAVYSRARKLNRNDWRCLLEILLVRADVLPAALTLRLSISAIAQILRTNLDLAGATPHCRVQRSGPTFAIRVNATLVAASRDFDLPVSVSPGKCSPDRKLINLLNRAFIARERVMSNRGKRLALLAREMKMTPSRFMRTLRLTYLAPDIQAAIMDGRQPADLTVRKLTYSPLPLDWSEQREMFGFITVAN